MKASLAPKRHPGEGAGH